VSRLILEGLYIVTPFLLHHARDRRKRRAGVARYQNNEWYRLRFAHTKELCALKARMHSVHFRDRDARNNVMRYLMRKKVHVFFFHSITRHACIFHDTSCLNIGANRGRHGCGSGRSLFFAAKATFYREIVPGQIGFLNVPFCRMDGWIIAFNEFALASKSRVALCSPSQRTSVVDNEWLHLQKFLLLVLRDAITESWDREVETTGPIVGAFARMYNRQTSVKSRP